MREWLILAALLASAPTPAMAAERCEVMTFTADAKGTPSNVRAAPSPSAPILYRIPADALVEVRLRDRRGVWFKLDRIVDAETGAAVFARPAWIHRSQVSLGVAGGSHHLHAAPSTSARRLMRLTPDGNLLDLIDCSGRWVRARVDGKLDGWLAPAAQCSNPMTTCN